jgi:leucyl aminopeptidase
MKSDVADVRNVSKTSGAGAITGAIFLNNFVEKVPWAHLDIAGTAWIEEDKDYIPKNATGFGVRLIVDVMKDF